MKYKFGPDVLAEFPLILFETLMAMENNEPADASQRYRDMELEATEDGILCLSQEYLEKYPRKNLE